ncbi:hypothetical protein XM25_10860 [Devosia sp. H5989]|nr:hypothetical protein XM25_10860 [Devosia sp. H5989]
MKTFSRYWGLYGGLRALLRSPYLYCALLVTVLCEPFWTKIDPQGESSWAQTSIDIIPSLLGFSMGGMAIMLAFSNATIFTAITQKGKPNSLFLTVVANFYHFILFQIISIILAIGTRAFPSVRPLSFFGFWAMIYAILVALATAGQLLRMAEVFNKAGGVDRDKNET